MFMDRGDIITDCGLEDIESFFAVLAREIMTVQVVQIVQIVQAPSFVLPRDAGEERGGGIERSLPRGIPGNNSTGRAVERLERFELYTRRHQWRQGKELWQGSAVNNPG